MSSAVGNRLRKLRERRGWSQLQVAEMLDVANFNISNYERGTREPDLKTLVRLSELYDVSVEWIVAGKSPDGQKTPDEEWIDLKEMMEESDAKWSYEGEPLTPEAKRRIADIVRFVLQEEKNKQ